MKRLLTALLILAAIPAWASYKPKVDVVTAFNTTNNLAGNTNFDSGVLDAQDYTQVQTHIESDTDGQMTFTFYADAAGNQVVRNLVVPYSAAGGFQLFSAPAFTPYIQYQFSNTTAGAQTEMFFETKFLTKGLTPQLLRTDGFISPSMISTLNRSVIVGEDSDGEFRNVPTDVEGHLKVNLNDPLTAFGDLRTAQLSPQVHLTFPYNINADLLDTTVANGGTVIATNSMARLNTSTASNGSAIMASRQTVNYRSGLGTLARFTGMFTTGVASSTQIIGIGDAADGYFIGYNGTSFGVLVRKDSSDTWTAATAWNVDTLDGSSDAGNPSGMNIDETKLNVFQISYQWLGAGQIEFSVEDPATGQFTPVHRIQYANANTDPSVYNPSLTLYAQVINSGNTSDLQLQTASMAGLTEGKNVVTGPVNIYGSASAVASVATIFSLRNKATYASKTNKVRVYLKTLTVANDTTSSAGKVSIWRNNALGGTPSWADVNGTDSVMEVDTAGTDTTGDRLLYTALVEKGGAGVFDLSTLDISILPGEIISVISEDGTMDAVLTWQEDF